VQSWATVSLRKYRLGSMMEQLIRQSMVISRRNPIIIFLSWTATMLR
jgi:TctA family transporter